MIIHKVYIALSPWPKFLPINMFMLPKITLSLTKHNTEGLNNDKCTAQSSVVFF